MTCGRALLVVVSLMAPGIVHAGDARDITVANGDVVLTVSPDPFVSGESVIHAPDGGVVGYVRPDPFKPEHMLIEFKLGNENGEGGDLWIEE